jgi:GntR family transcriptional regulator/MocR family aminotransferase
LARRRDARFAVVTPSHQAPLGMALSLPRRLALLDWAARSGAWIVEDDYYGEFRLQGRPLAALKSLDAAGRVLYVGTFSKVLLPGLRLGYIVVPTAEVETFARIAGFLSPSQALFSQLAVAEFMTEGHFARHVRRMRNVYAERRTALVQGLRDAFGDCLRIGLQDSGMHLIAHLPAVCDDVALARRAEAAGLGPVPLSPWAIEAKTGPGLVMSFANVTPPAAPRIARRLERALHLPRPRR